VGVAEHLTQGGEAWLVLSDLAERLGLRSRDELLELIKLGGLKVLERMDARPTHKKITDENDPLHAARAAEVTSLWRLTTASFMSL
jgi:prophage antirepressor-like protein